MSVKLLNEHHLEYLSLKGGCTGLSESTLVENATFFEITCHGSIMIVQCITDNRSITGAAGVTIKPIGKPSTNNEFIDQ